MFFFFFGDSHQLPLIQALPATTVVSQLVSIKSMPITNQMMEKQRHLKFVTRLLQNLTNIQTFSNSTNLKFNIHMNKKLHKLISCKISYLAGASLYAFRLGTNVKLPFLPFACCGVQTGGAVPM